MKITNVKDFKKALSFGPYAWPGGYPLFFVTSDGAALCVDCANAESEEITEAITEDDRSGWKVEAIEINYEDCDCYCDHCSEKIPAAYCDDE